MTTNYNPKLMFGLPYPEIEKLIDVDKLIDDGILDTATQSYDSERKYWIVGVPMQLEYDNLVNLAQAVCLARTEFESITQLTIGRIIVCQDVW